MISGSTHPRLISERFAEVDVAAGEEELDYSGFIFDKHQTGCKTQASKIAKEIMETNVHCSRAGKVCYKYICSSTSIRLRSTRRTVSDLLDVELYNDNRKMFNQAFEETVLALGNVLDEHVLEMENVYERQVKNTLMKHAIIHHISKTLFRKRSREATREHVDF